MKVKTRELEGVALDWAVATAIDAGALFEDWGGPDPWVVLSDYNALEWVPFAPSTDWSQGGTLIEGLKVSVEWYGDIEDWCADVMDPSYFHAYGRTPLIAACRAIVSAKLGEEVDVPEELL